MMASMQQQPVTYVTYGGVSFPLAPVPAAPLPPQQIVFFAVRQGSFGLKRSIFISWDDVQIFLSGIQNAEFQSFYTIQEALQYIMMPPVVTNEPLQTDQSPPVAKCHLELPQQQASLRISL